MASLSIINCAAVRPRRLGSDAQAKVAAKSLKPALETGTDGRKFPFAAMTIQLGYDNGRLDRIVFAEVVAEKLLIFSRIDDADICV